MSVDPEFRYSDLLPTGVDRTPYRLLTSDGVRTFEADGRTFLQFALVMVLTLTLGLMTPPVGVCLFVACRIGNISMTKLVKELLPFFLAELAVVVLIVLFPGIASWLPGLFR